MNTAQLELAPSETSAATMHALVYRGLKVALKAR